MGKFKLLMVLIVAMLVMPSFVFAELNYMDEVTVLGAQENLATLPGSGDRISTENIRLHNRNNINAVLRSVPGVYLREEDGYGLFPNISLRGVDTTRSAKVTVMEDEILTAPAPYSAPSAYYTPATGRMDGIEVLKGSSQIKYGPHTTGGVINYISTPIPQDHNVYIKSFGGTDKEFGVHTYVGGNKETDHGTFGVVFEEYYHETDGFKEIDKVGGETGFERSDPMIKLSWEPNSDKYKRFEIKAGYSDLVAHETYLGVTDEDFDRKPYLRYAGSRFDKIDTEQSRFYWKYLSEITSSSSGAITAYYNKFQRDWFKINKVHDGATSVSLASAIGQNGSHLGVLKGEASGTLEYRHNNRSYELWGVSSDFDVDFDLANASHKLEFGLGYHEDYVRRLQQDVDFTQDGSGNITATSFQALGEAGNRKQQAQAVRFHVRDNIELGSLTLTPGYRYEAVDYTSIDYDTSGTLGYGTATRSDHSELSASAFGIGATYKIDDAWTLFGGIHEGFSLPGPRAHARNGLGKEESLATEFGIRYNSDALVSELLYFHTDFDNLLVVDNIGGTGTGNDENVGDVISQGVEWKLAYDWAKAKQKDYSNPYYLALTYTRARLDGDSNSTDPESIFSGGLDGNKVPYIPDFQIGFGAAFNKDKWGVALDGTFVTETFTSADNVNSSSTDARFGKTDEYLIFDLSTHYNLTDDVKTFFNIQNLTDQKYVVSRHPHGARPGKPFTALAGVEIQF